MTESYYVLVPGVLQLIWPSCEGDSLPHFSGEKNKALGRDINPTFLPPRNAFPHNQHLYFLFTKQTISIILLDYPRSPQMLFFHFRVKTNKEGKKK